VLLELEGKVKTGKFARKLETKTIGRHNACQFRKAKFLHKVLRAI
jgi:hypothetical protein